MSEQLTADETAAMQAMQAEPVEAVEATEVQNRTEIQPEPQVETPAAEPDKPPPGMVPQGALHQERERRKEAERQNGDIQRQLAELQAQVQKLTEPPPAEIVIPDPVLDPKGFKQFQIDQINQRAQEKAETQRQQQEATQQQGFINRLSHDVQTFRAATPDYDAAFQYAVQARRSELAFYGNSPEQIEAQMEVDVKALAEKAYSEGRNPGEVYYEFAKMRGYQPAAPVTPQPNPAAAQVAALAEAQKQTQSLAPAGGPANDGGMTLETLSRMSEADLAKMPKAQRDEVMRKAMGG